MTIEVNPVGIRCNLSCNYCYQTPMRDAGNFSTQVDVERMVEALEKTNQDFTLFGGEALLTPIPVLERLFRLGYDRYGHNSIQTNGSLISDAHLELFRRYNVSVGFSIDGPDELNDMRWAGSLEKTRMMSSRSRNSLYELLRENHPCSLIVTLHRLNGVGIGLDKLCNWFMMLSDLGLRWARLHLLEVDHPEIEKFCLAEDEAFEAIIILSELPSKIDIDMFSEIPRMMQGNDTNTSCIWNGCDPFRTEAVYGVNSDGSLSNCGRTNKSGVNFLKAESMGNERYHALINIPQESGGCKDCKYFPICGGECPGQSDDWRNHTRHCGLLKKIFAYYEKKVGYNPKPRVHNDHSDRAHQDHYDLVGPIVVEVR
jgi:uncharacterized protein